MVAPGDCPNDERKQMESVVAVVFLAGIFGLGYWIGAMRTKLKASYPTMDMKQYQKLKKALDDSVQKAREFHVANK